MVERILETLGYVAFGIGIAAFVIAALPVWLLCYLALRTGLAK